MSEPGSLEPALEEFLNWLAVERSSSPHTISAYRRDVREYVAFLAARDIRDADAVTPDDVAAFLRATGERGLAARSQARLSSSVRRFHIFMVSEGLTENLPTGRLRAPRFPSGLPRVLSVADVERLLESSAAGDARGLRDRAMLELLYATGMRISELGSLDVSHLDLAEAEVRVRGKGGKERLLP
ncbi:MAG: site-specific integrase, partial [Candidatus Geothermincolia bacterium]